MNEKIKNVWHRILNHPAIFFLLSMIIGLILIIILDILDKEFNWHDIKVEAHGLIFDLFVFGLLLTLYEALKSKKLKIDQLKDEIDDFRRWDEKEATFRIVGRIKRLNKEGVSSINLAHCYLKKAYLNKANLKQAVLRQANLEGAELGSSNLQNAILIMANLIEVELGGANLQDSKLLNANLEGAWLWGANLQNANLNSANLHKANLSRANLVNANLKGANLTDIILEEANLQNLELGGVDLSGINLNKAHMRKVYLAGANLQGAQLRESNLEEAVLFSANLQKADLRGTKLSNANLMGVKLEGARIDSYDWLDRLSELNVEGIQRIQTKYFVKAAVLNEFMISGFGIDIFSYESNNLIISRKACDRIRDSFYGL